MILTITAQFRSKGTIAPSVSKDCMEYRYTQQNKSGYGFRHLDSYVIQLWMNNHGSMWNKLKRINIRGEKHLINNRSTSNNKWRVHVSQSSQLSPKTYAWLLVSKLTARVTSFALNWENIFFLFKLFVPSLSYADSSFMGVSDVSRLNCTVHTYFWRAWHKDRC